MEGRTCGFDGVGNILETVARHHGDDSSIGGDQALLAGLLQRRRAGDTGRLTEHAAGLTQQALGSQNLLIRHADGETVGLADGSQSLVGVAGHANGDGVGDGVLLHRLPRSVVLNGAVDGIAAVGLGGDQTGQLVDEADGVQILKALPHAGDGAAVTHGDGEIIGHLPVQLLGDLQCHRLFTLAQIGVNGGVAVIPAVLINGGGGHLEGVLIVALDGDDIGAEDHQLRYLALRGALGDENEGLEPCGSGVARQRGGGIARGGAGDGLCPCLQCLGNGHGAGAVFQRGRGVLTVILHPQLTDAQHLSQFGLFIEGTPTYPQGGVGGGFLDRQQLTVAPHGAVIACSQLLLGEDGLNVVVIVDDVENAAAFAVGQIGGGLIGLAAADTLTVFYVFHGCFSLKKNAGRGRMPRPATIVIQSFFRRRVRRKNSATQAPWARSPVRTLVVGDLKGEPAPPLRIKVLSADRLPR